MEILIQVLICQYWSALLMVALWYSKTARLFWADNPKAIFNQKPPIRISAFTP